MQVAVLQQRHGNGPDNRKLNMYTHVILALAFVPVDDATRIFNLLSDDAPDATAAIIHYFNATYVSGRLARGRR